MFEFKTAIHAIPNNVLYLYYMLLLVTYIIFLRNIKMSELTFVILLLFNQGFIILFDSSNRASKIIFTVLCLTILIKGRSFRLPRVYIVILWSAILFTAFFYMNYLFYGNSLLWASYQYYKYFVPIALFFGIKGLNLSENSIDYYGKLIIKLLWFQIVFSIIKIAVIGLRENITGSISDTGGGIGVGYATLGLVLYWVLKGKNLKSKDWWFVLLILLIPGASNKRAIWFIYPIVLGAITFQGIDRLKLRKLSYLIVMLPLLVYFGFRLNPTLNPEKKIWGTFNSQYALDYALSYSGVSEEKRDADLAQGRWGASTAIVSYTIANPLLPQSLLGNSLMRSGRIDKGEIWVEDYGMQEYTGISAIGAMIIGMGWPATFLMSLIFIFMTFIIKDKKVRNIIIFLLLWDLIFYSGSFINITFQSILFVFVIHIVARQTQQSCQNSL